MPLKIEHREVKPGVVVVALAGRVMLGDESAKIESLVQQLLQEGRSRVVFDLAGVTHIDSTGIGRFISCLNKTRMAGGSMLMANASGQVRDAFRVTRLDTVFQFVGDVDTALQGLS